MSEEYYITQPSITAALLSPNPVLAGSTLRIQVTADMETIQLFPELLYSGEIYAGDDIL